MISLVLAFLTLESILSSSCFLIKAFAPSTTTTTTTTTTITIPCADRRRRRKCAAQRTSSSSRSLRRLLEPPTPPTTTSSSSSYVGSSEIVALESTHNIGNETDTLFDSIPSSQTTLDSNTINGNGNGDGLPANVRTTNPQNKRKLELSWCNHDACYDAIREKVVGEHNHMELTGPATGQVVYSWNQPEASTNAAAASPRENINVVPLSSSSTAPPPAVLMLVKRDEEELLSVAVNTIERLMISGVQVLVDAYLWEKMENYCHDDGDDHSKKFIDLESSMIRLFLPKPVSGFGSGEELIDMGYIDSKINNDSDALCEKVDREGRKTPADLSDADLVVTLGGDGLLMHAAHVFSGPVPPILPVAGGSMGFLTPFSREEMFEAILIALGLQDVLEDVIIDEDLNDEDSMDGNDGLKISQKALNHMLIEATTREGYNENPPLAFGNNKQICISMRMRLDCRIFGVDGSLRARYAVLNEVVIDRGSSPYLASLECFCDDVHLTTVQADGIIFSTPTGSTAYSMAAGGSVVHPAVPAILVTPICPHVLSFRSMIFPDHVVLRCYVPSDARSTACVYFDGKHRTELNRGDSVQIQMSSHPVPTINRADHSADWLSSLKRNFNFNTRVRQGPLS